MAFDYYREPNLPQTHWRTDVWVAPSTGGRARKLTRSKGGASYPTFSPDGRQVVFVGHENGEAGSARDTPPPTGPAEGGQAPRSLSAPIDRSVVGYPVALGGQSFAWLPDGSGLLFLAGDRGM